MEKLENIMKKMNEIEYGFCLNDKNIYPEDDNKWENEFGKNYYLQSPEQLLQTKLGVCWDQVELERYFFEQEKINCKSYFIVEYDGVEYPTHTFMLVFLNDKCYYFEHSWEPYRGIKEFNSIDEALNSVKMQFQNMLMKRNISIEEIVIYEYKKPQYHITADDFFKHCENGKKL